MAPSMLARPEALLARRGGWVELLRAPAALFGWSSSLRNWLYSAGVLPSARVDAPVVSVGNLGVGGTGKTPLVVWLVRELEGRGRRPGLLSRGYRARHGANDEGRMLAELLPQLEHVAGPDRIAGAYLLLERGVDVVLLDDGFQHRRLARDLDLVLIDATRPWGLPAPRPGVAPVCALLPRGLLREAPAGLARAHALVLTRCDQVEAAQLESLVRELEGLAPGVPQLLARHAPQRLRAHSGRSEALEALAGREVDLLSAIGNPDAFEASVRALGAKVHLHRRLADHAPLGAPELAGLGAGGRWVLCTHKDRVKLASVAPDLLALEVEFEWLSSTSVLEALLEALPRSSAGAARAALHGGLAG